MTTDLLFKPLSSHEVSNMYEKCLHLLSTSGVKVDHQEALKMLDKAGAQVNADDKRVRFPVDIIESALRSVPHSVTLAGREKRHDITLPHPDGLFAVSNSTGCRLIVDPVTNNYRDVTLADIAEYGQLTELLDDINICLFLTPSDVPGETGDIHSMKTVLENTLKHVEAQPWSFASVKYLFELAPVAAGSAESMRKRPVSHVFSCSISPFVFSDMDMEVIIQACRLGVPVGAYSLPSAGATSPITIAGTVLEGGAEILAQLVMSQLFQPGVPVMGGLGNYTLDMSTGRVQVENIETILASAAFVQFIKEAFHIPAKSHGFGTDSYIPDGQAMMAIGLRSLIGSLSGNDILSHAGRLNSALAVSPVKLIIDNELAKVLKRIKAGIKVDDDYLAWKEILSIEPGGHYLELPHTLKHCREALRSRLAVTQPRDAWSAEGRKDLQARMVEEYRELKRKLKPPELPEEVKKELNNIVKKADEKLVK